MKLSNNRLRTKSGKTIKFKSAKARNRYERVAKAIKQGWKPEKNKLKYL